MAAGNVTLAGSRARDFDVDTNQYTATLQKPGGKLFNMGSNLAYIDTDGGTVSTTAGGGSCPVPVSNLQPVTLPPTCQSFTFKGAGATTLRYEPA